MERGEGLRKDVFKTRAATEETTSQIPATNVKMSLHKSLGDWLLFTVWKGLVNFGLVTTKFI